MITTPTVFVLGAGASIPYGFPSGAQLRDMIIAGLADAEKPNPTPLWAILRNEFGHSHKEIQEFRRAFEAAETRSIDVFLTRRTEFAAIGKVSIALALKPLERPTRMFGSLAEPNGRWYWYLLDLLDAPPDEFFQNRVQFVTFNYDRSLEHYLFRTLRQRHGCADDVCASMVNHLNITHVHGQLAHLPWQSSDAAQPYDGSARVEHIRAAAERIRIVSEDPDDKELAIRIGVAIREAQQVFFIGCGFDRQNMDRIGYRPRPGTKRTMGTRLGLEDGEVVHLVSYTKIPNKYLFDLDALTFLRRHRHHFV